MIRRRPPPNLYATWRASVLKFLLFGCLTASLVSATTQKKNGDPTDYLDEDSVILITGAAGFIGSELALALYHTYSPKRILCIDRMGGDLPSTQEALALFEFQRQRAFHIMQTLGPTGRFYRVDFRPMIPEYFDMGEVPVLDHIFRENPDITHIVHLADPFPHSALQAVPREKDVPKAGMIEALFEQMLKVEREGGRVPHFSYASSYEVYPYATDEATTTPLKETQPISTPSSLRGASKLIDEILAKLYFDERGLYSVGLRFFSVYGPWSIPGSPLYEMAERAVNGQLQSWDPHWNTIQDHVYIDDAIDALMAAMQFRPSGDKPHPIVFNVASGEGSSLGDVAKIMTKHFPRGEGEDSYTGDEDQTPGTHAVGSTERAEQLLGYKPRVRLDDGIEKLLAWHYDRAYPYGNKENFQKENIRHIANQGIIGCLPNDTECLKSAPVFPCASECAHESQCTATFYDEIVGWTQALTAKCETVLYTVALDDKLKSIPSAHAKIKAVAGSFLDGNCNLAFVSHSSPMIQSAQSDHVLPSILGNGRKKILTNGKWILVPVATAAFPVGDEHVLGLLPKLSPGLFFGPRTKRAIYVDPDIILESIPKLLQEASMQPQNDEVEGATALLIGRGKPKDYFAEDDDDSVPKQQVFASTSSIVQNAAYRMVHIAMSGTLFGDGFMALLDSRWMVHTLQSDDSRLFRCDVYGEVVQWDVDSDRSALEFVLGLHDLWSRVIAEKPWWIDENVITVPESRHMRRRLQETDDNSELKIGEDNEDVEEEEEEGEDDEETEDNAGEEADEGDDEADEKTEEDDAVGEEAEDSEGDEEEEEEEEDGRGGFGKKGEAVEEVAAGDKKRGDSSEQDDDQVMADGVADPLSGKTQLEDRDFSSYDTWMGVLSATTTKYFVRIVPSSEVGVFSVGEINVRWARH